MYACIHVYRLPLEDLSGQPMYAEGSQKSNKKEAVVKCALEACRLLDNEDVLRNPMRSKTTCMKDDNGSLLKVINARREIGKRTTIMTAMRITSLIGQEMVCSRNCFQYKIIIIKLC